MKVFRVAILVLTTAALWAGWKVYVARAPANYNIAAPLDLSLAPTFITLWKLDRASASACFAALDRIDIDYTRLPDKMKGEGCFFESAATLDRSLVSWGGGVTLACPMLARLALWERHTLLPKAEALFESDIVRIRHFGSYACRNVNNAATGRRSEHARAAAIDFAGVALADGSEISVLDDYGKATPEGAFLAAIFDGACELFPVVLGPRYNALHRNHFHFGGGGFSICR